MRLSRERVLVRALTLLDEVGLEALTMRRLASALGVQPGALYWHFANKQALQDAMAEKMMEGLLEPELLGAWDAQLAELSRRLRDAIGRHRDGARLVVQAIVPGQAGLAVSERMLRILRDAGFSTDTTLGAAAVLGYYIIGFLVDTEGTELAKARGLVSSARAITKKLDPKQYPVMVAVGDRALDELVTAGSAEKRFEHGLQVVLAGIKAAAAAERAARGRRKASSRGGRGRAKMRS